MVAYANFTPEPPPRAAIRARNETEDQHEDIPEADRYVYVIIKDAHDSHGPGMIFKLGFLEAFKNCLDTFRVKSCPNCRPVSDIRFKTHNQIFADITTPKRIGFWHNTTTTIRAYSNVPGMQCSKCKIQGYPSSTVPTKAVPQTMTSVPKNEVVALRVRDLTGFEMEVKMMNITPFSFLMEQYATKAWRKMSDLRFLLDEEKLLKTETPKKLDLSNGDLIDVYFEQLGGRKQSLDSRAQRRYLTGFLGVMDGEVTARTWFGGRQSGNSRAGTTNVGT
ncbi:uncharacterized protein LTR77_001713 [Saxophila tyrrhenica]|uniref:Rad60/SUMO-like domain-containing protein n=1 Tax=Saxophila tyrrhenica TaxID=1690608 RepID=A0AAV9PMW9_9PEZI|nr:hypothetical protein LTR77_001713 [Saxophila tyrrhenica]